MKNKYVILQYKNFRVAKITRINLLQDSFVHHDSPISTGLAIEAKCNDTGHYVVIAFVKPTEGGGYMYESVGGRIEEYCKTWDDVIIFRQCLAVAIKEIQNAIETEAN